MAHTPGKTPFDKEIEMLEAYQSEGNSLAGSIKCHYGGLLNRRRGYRQAKDEDKVLRKALDKILESTFPSAMREIARAALSASGGRKADTKARGGG